MSVCWFCARWVTRCALPSTYWIPGKHIKPGILWKRIQGRATAGHWAGDKINERKWEKATKRICHCEPYCAGLKPEAEGALSRGLLSFPSLIPQGQQSDQLGGEGQFAINHFKQGLTRSFVLHFYWRSCITEEGISFAALISFPVIHSTPKKVMWSCGEKTGGK